MKNIFNIILLLTVIGCKAQNPILDISQLDGWDSISGTYYKDTNNLLNPFEGTYLYTNGSTSFKIVLQKKLRSSVNNRYFEDILIGEYQYIQNGIEKVNTLSKLDIDYPNKRKHSIGGGYIITQGDIGCEDCAVNEKALMGGLVDRASENSAQLIIRRVTVNGQPAIKIFILWSMTWYKQGEPEPAHASIPGGYYTLLKQ